MIAFPLYPTHYLIRCLINIEVTQYIFFELNSKLGFLAFISLTLTLYTLHEVAQDLKADFSKFIQFEKLW